MSKRNSTPRFSLVYFIRFGDFGPIKIGKTCRDVRVRLSIIQLSCPEQLHLLATISEPDESNCEESLHERFAHLRIRGEWFDSAPELTEFIAAHAEPFDQDPRYVKVGGKRWHPLYSCETWRWTREFDDIEEDGLHPVSQALIGDPDRKRRVRHILCAVMMATRAFRAEEIARLFRINRDTVFQWIQKANAYDDPEADLLRRVRQSNSLFMPDPLLPASERRRRKKSVRRRKSVRKSKDEAMFSTHLASLPS